ncbi:hypothetical protein B0H10DRAFT_2237490 [Mycena sp. CBHHK59/15]|nr:hypothetical protein B0H10DRAFT_2237490 [Mycena sp. CBHHK59/15]
MPTMLFCAGSNDLCYRCNDPGDPKLRRCARCHVARYCSPECQKADWSNHKPICVDHKAVLQNDAETEENLKLFMKWLDYWRNGLLAWAAFSADLANQPADYLLDHCYILEVVKQPQPAKHSVRSKFFAVLGGMRTEAQIQEEFARIRHAGYREQVCENFQRIAPQKDLLRVVVVAYPFYSVAGEHLGNLFPNGQARTFANPLSPSSRLLSTKLERAWREWFAEHVRTGNVTGHTQVLQTLTQVNECEAEVASSVD